VDEPKDNQPQDAGSKPQFANDPNLTAAQVATVLAALDDNLVRPTAQTVSAISSLIGSIANYCNCTPADVGYYAVAAQATRQKSDAAQIKLLDILIYTDNNKDRVDLCSTIKQAAADFVK